jgi:threonyl-tRNA synthetase
MAVQRLYKGAQVGVLGIASLLPVAHLSPALPQVTIGPWTERGFFYDFDMPESLTERDLPKIRKEMHRIVRMNLPFVREEVSAEEARQRIQARSRS